MSLSDDAVESLLQRAVDLVDEELVNSHIQSQSNGKFKLATILDEGRVFGFSSEVRQILGLASRKRGSGWFKSVTKFEGIAADIVGPNLAAADKGFVELVDSLKRWTHAT